MISMNVICQWRLWVLWGRREIHFFHGKTCRNATNLENCLILDFSLCFRVIKGIQIVNKTLFVVYIYIYIYIFRVSRKECARLRENVP